MTGEERNVFLCGGRKSTSDSRLLCKTEGREGGNVGVRALRRDVKTRRTSTAALMLQMNFLSDVPTTCWDPHSRTIWWERTCGSIAAIQQRTHSNTRHLLSATEQLLKPLFWCRDTSHDLQSATVMDSTV